jgi:DNA modification methylase
VDIFKSAGFKFIDTIIWEKNKFIPTQGSKRLNNVYDFIFQFSKGDSYHLDRESIAYLRTDRDSDYACAGNIWKIKVDDKDTLPQELVSCIIKLSNILPNSLIVDPFMGNGSTLKTALEMGHSYWGCEADTDAFKTCQKIIRDFKAKEGR